MTYWTPGNTYMTLRISRDPIFVVFPYTVAYAAAALFNVFVFPQPENSKIFAIVLNVKT